MSTQSRDENPTGDGEGDIEVLTISSRRRVGGVISQMGTEEGMRPDRGDPTLQRPNRSVATPAPAAFGLR